MLERQEEEEKVQPKEKVEEGILVIYELVRCREIC